MAKKIEPEIVLLLQNQFAIMAALKAVMLGDVPNTQCVPILVHQLTETDKAIQSTAVRDSYG